MVFNLAAGALIYDNYLNKNTARVTYTEYALSITQLALIIFMLIVLVIKPKTIVSILLLGVQIFNIYYSVQIIQYYEHSISVDKTLSNLSLAIIIINALNICGFFGINNTYTEKRLLVIW